MDKEIIPNYSQNNNVDVHMAFNVLDYTQNQMFQWIVRWLVWYLSYWIYKLQSLQQ